MSERSERTINTGGNWWALIEERAARTPDAVMLTDERGRSLTFDAFRATAESVAAGLTGLGVRPEHTVSWQLPTTIEAVVLMAALTRLGVAQNPIIPILRRAEVGQIVGQLASEWLVVPGVRRGFDHAEMARQVAGDGKACRVVVLDDFSGDLSLPRRDPSTLLPPTEPGHSIRWYYYSSGTTAAPKGARHTDASVMAAAAWIIDGVRFASDDVMPVAFPIAHIGGIMLLTAQLRVGARLVLFEAFDPVASPLAMAEHEPTLLGSALPFFQSYLAAQRAHGAEPLFPKLRQFVGGGAPLPPEVHVELLETFGCRTLNSWGLTEFPAVTTLSADDPENAFVHTVGRPVGGVEVRVVDLDGAEVPTGGEGELRVRGPQCFAGYVDSSLDADAFDEKGFFRTGDLGIVDDDGYVQVTGRLKDIIVRNAENISALEVENVLYEHAAIADVAVVGLPDRRTGERACAVVVLAPGVEAVTLADLAAHCLSHGLAKQKVPEQLELVTELPRNQMGKVLKHELRARLASTSE